MSHAERDAELAAELAKKAALLEAAKAAVDRLDEAQGEWMGVSWAYVPEHIRALRSIANPLREAIAAAETEKESV